MGDVSGSQLERCCGEDLEGDQTAGTVGLSAPDASMSAPWPVKDAWLLVMERDPRGRLVK